MVGGSLYDMHVLIILSAKKYIHRRKSAFQAKTFPLLSYSRAELMQQGFRPASTEVRFLDVGQASVN